MRFSRRKLVSPHPTAPEPYRLPIRYPPHAGMMVFFILFVVIEKLPIKATNPYSKSFCGWGSRGRSFFQKASSPGDFFPLLTRRLTLQEHPHELVGLFRDVAGSAGGRL